MVNYVKYPITPADRLKVRIFEGYRELMEFDLQDIGSMTELLGEIRHRGCNLKGLMKLTVRNFNQGWRMERFMKFYEGVPSPFRRQLHACLSGQDVTKGIYGKSRQSPHMPFPWETH